MKLLQINRQWYTPSTAIGQLLLPDGVHFCYTLSDTPRCWGVKVKGATAIPTNYRPYKVAITFSQRFQKELPVIYTSIENGKYILREGGIEFESIRFHSGNTSEQTEGCELIAYNYDGVDKIYNPDPNNPAIDKLTLLIKQWINEGDQVGLIVKNMRNKLE